MHNEREYRLQLDRHTVNFLTSLMPTLEGLFLATVLDGQRGEVRLCYHPTVEDEMQDLLRDLESRGEKKGTQAPAGSPARTPLPSQNELHSPRIGPSTPAKNPPGKILAGQN